MSQQVVGDGLGNPAYDAERSQAEANGTADTNTDRYLSQPGGNNPPPISASRVGAGFQVLDTDVWEIGSFSNSKIPTYIKRYSAGEPVTPEVALTLGLVGPLGE
jgi:hypothetical protein